MENIDLALLLRQKRALLRVINNPSISKPDRTLLDGILNLLDAIHDEIDPPAEVSE